MSLKKQALSGMSWTLFQQFGVSGISFIVQIILARLIAPEEFGIFGLLLIFNAVGNSLSDSGMGQSIIRSDNLEEDDYGTIFLTNLGVSIIIYLIICGIGPWVADFYNEPIIAELMWVYSFSIILMSFSSIQMYRLTRMLDFKKQAMIQIPSIFISGIVGIVLGYMGYGVWALVIMQVVQNFVLSLQYWILTGWRPKFIFNKNKFRYHFDFGYKLTLSGLLNTIFTNIYPMVIGKFYSTAQVGFFTRADTMKNFPITSITSALNKVTYPLFAKVKNDNERLKNAYQKMQKMVVFILSAAMLLLIVIAHPLFEFLLGSEWLPAVPYFQLLCISGIFYPIHAYNLNILKVKGRSDQFLKAAIIKKSTMLIGILATVKFGMIPLILALVLNNVISLFVNMYYGTKHIDYPYKEQLKDMFLSVLPALLTASISYSVLYYLKSFSNISQILITSIIYGVVYLLINLLGKSESFIELISIIKNIKNDKLLKENNS